MLELGGAYADDVLVLTGVADQIVDQAVAAVKQSALSAGRASEDVDLRWGVLVSVDDDRQTAVDRALPYLVQWTNQGLFDLGQRWMGWEPQRISAGVAESGHLVDRLLDNFCIVGSAETCAVGLQALASRSRSSRLFCMLAGSTEVQARSMEQLSAALR
jgi:alkanesulfonate monooxygenase SsuD/methylene tetrahydromethanopterin reductase-like flavin-dependent oxidoreductase (luciferase family)